LISFGRQDGNVTHMADAEKLLRLQHTAYRLISVRDVLSTATGSWENKQQQQNQKYIKK